MEGAFNFEAGVVARAHARVGLVLREKWRLDHVIGVGGMAAVYAATHRNGSRAAIKMLHLEHCIDEDTHRRFLREGYMANTVGHPGTVRVLDDDVCEDGAVFIVMELLEGETLDARAGRLGSKMTLSELLPIIDALLDILAAAHDKGIVHRDIKPDNVFITGEGVVKLLDFGIARLRTMHPGNVVTLGNATLGTPAFMSPEQALGRSEEIDAQSDVWSVGAVMFSLLAGRYVHLAETLTEQLVAHASRPAVSLANVAPDVPLPIVSVVDRALFFQRAFRWPSARAMQQAIREAQVALGQPGASTPPAPASGANRMRGLAVPHALALTPGPAGAASLSALADPSSASIALVGASPGSAESAQRGSLRQLLAFGIAGAAAVLIVGLLILRPDRHADNTPAPLLAAPTATVSVTATVDAPATAISVEPAPPPSASALPTASASGRPSDRPGPHRPAPFRPPPRSSGTPAAGSAKPPDEDWLNRQH